MSELEQACKRGNRKTNEEKSKVMMMGGKKVELQVEQFSFCSSEDINPHDYMKMRDRRPLVRWSHKFGCEKKLC